MRVDSIRPMSAIVCIVHPEESKPREETTRKLESMDLKHMHRHELVSGERKQIVSQCACLDDSWYEDKRLIENRYSVARMRPLG
jgi:hypothetical protein